MKIKKIDDVELDSPLWLVEADSSIMIQATSVSTISGGKVFFEQLKKNQSITLTSGDSGWLTTNTKNILIHLANNSLGKNYDIVTTDGYSIPVRFAHETGHAIEFSRVVDTELCEYHTVIINLVMVV